METVCTDAKDKSPTDGFLRHKLPHGAGQTDLNFLGHFQSQQMGKSSEVQNTFCLSLNKDFRWLPAWPPHEGFWGNSDSFTHFPVLGDVVSFFL